MTLKKTFQNFFSFLSTIIALSGAFAIFSLYFVIASLVISLLLKLSNDSAFLSASDGSDEF